MNSGWIIKNVAVASLLLFGAGCGGFSGSPGISPASILSALVKAEPKPALTGSDPEAKPPAITAESVAAIN